MSNPSAEAFLKDAWDRAPLSDTDVESVRQLLGRSPRGLRSIPVRSQSAHPVVIEVASLIDKKPFPTLFWLVDKQLNYAIDQLEASGYIAELQVKVDSSAELQMALEADHLAYIDLRLSLIPQSQLEEIRSLGFEAVLSKRGIGGIENFSRIRCLHTYYASHLVKSNAVGRLVDRHWAENGVNFQHL